MRYAIVLAAAVVAGLLLLETQRPGRAERKAPETAEAPQPGSVPPPPAAAEPEPSAEDAPGAREVRQRPEPEPGVIAGVVLDQDGETPVDATVMLYRDGAWILASPTESGTGRFRFRDLREDRYSVGLRVRLDAALGRPSEELLVVRTGTTDLRIVLEPRSWITFRILDAATREPIQADRAVFEVREDGDQRRCSAGGPGTDFPMRWHWAPATSLRLYATAVGYARSEIVGLDLGAGPEDRELVFRLAPDPGSLATLTIDVRDDAGAPVRSLCIWREAGGGFGGEDRKAEDGRYVIESIPAGKRTFRIGAPVFARTLETPWLDQELRVELARGERATRTVTLRRGGWLRLLGGPDVVLRSDTGDLMPDFTNTRRVGRVAIVPPGRYRAVPLRWNGDPIPEIAVEIVAGKVCEVSFD